MYWHLKYYDKEGDLHLACGTTKESLDTFIGNAIINRWIIKWTVKNIKQLKNDEQTKK